MRLKRDGSKSLGHFLDYEATPRWTPLQLKPSADTIWAKPLPFLSYNILYSYSTGPTLAFLAVHWTLGESSSYDTTLGGRDDRHWIRLDFGSLP